MNEGERFPEMLPPIECSDPDIAVEIARRWNQFQNLPADMHYDSVRDSLKIGEQEFSMEFLRFFGRHSIGVTFKIIENDNGIAIETVKPNA
jgi:hypothetical protein